VPTLAPKRTSLRGQTIIRRENDAPQPSKAGFAEEEFVALCRTAQPMELWPTSNASERSQNFLLRETCLWLYQKSGIKTKLDNADRFPIRHADTPVQKRFLSEKRSKASAFLAPRSFKTERLA
jgi:hypothetical protein